MIGEMNSRQGGFTLVELAIVMVIIGLLIGGVLKGQELINQAQYKKTLTILKGVQAAGETFRDKYAALPGDMLNANNRLPSCAAGCNGGDGNGIIGLQNTQANIDQTGMTAPMIETSLFWRHLAAADLISGVSAGANMAVPTGGVTHPISPMGGVLSVYHRDMIHGVSVKACANNSTACTAGFLSPRDIARFDVLMDNVESPNTGNVIANGGPECGYATGVYNLSNNTASCYVLFAMKF